MGAWNTGNFSNDTALDYLVGVTSLNDLKRPLDAVVSDTLKYIDADLASEALAAADILAGTLGRPATDLPEEAKDLIPKLGKPPTELLKLAKTAATRVMEASELAELWEEEDSRAWKVVVGDLLQRLNPNATYKPKKSKPPPKGGFICSVCEEMIAANKHIRVEIGFLNMPGVTMGRYFHRSCIEAAFKPPYFNKQGDPTSRLKRQIKRFLRQKDKASQNS